MDKEMKETNCASHKITHLNIEYESQQRYRSGWTLNLWS